MLQPVRQCLEEGLHVRMPKHLRHRHAGRCARQPSAVLGPREDQRPHLVAVQPGDHGVPHARIAFAHDACPQRPDADEGAGGELEVLRDAAVETQAALGVPAVEPAHGVPRAVEPFLVEGLRGKFRLTPVARHQVRSPEPDLGLACGGIPHQLGLHTWHRQTQVPGGRVRAHREGAGGCRLGHAQAGDHAHPLPDGGLGMTIQPVPYRLRQAGTGEHHRLAAAEQAVAQRVVGVHRIDQRLEASGDVEVDGGRNLAQVVQGRADALGRGLAVVDVQRATVEQGESHVVAATEHVVPREPVHQHRGLVGQEGQALAQHLLVGAQHAVGGDHALGQAGRARGEEDLHHRVRSGCGMRRADGLPWLGAQQRLEVVHWPAFPPPRVRQGGQTTHTWHRGIEARLQGRPVGAVGG